MKFSFLFLFISPDLLTATLKFKNAGRYFIYLLILSTTHFKIQWEWCLLNTSFDTVSYKFLEAH